jgi:hypothetical protein
MRLKKLQKKQKKGKYDGPVLPETIVLDIPTPRYALCIIIVFMRYFFQFLAQGPVALTAVFHGFCHHSMQVLG